MDLRAVPHAQEAQTKPPSALSVLMCCLAPREMTRKPSGAQRHTQHVAAKSQQDEPMQDHDRTSELDSAPAGPQAPQHVEPAWRPEKHAEGSKVESIRVEVADGPHERAAHAAIRPGPPAPNPLAGAQAGQGALPHGFSDASTDAQDRPLRRSRPSRNESHDRGARGSSRRSLLQPALTVDAAGFDAQPSPDDDDVDPGSPPPVRARRARGASEFNGRSDAHRAVPREHLRARTSVRRYDVASARGARTSRPEHGDALAHRASRRARLASQSDAMQRPAAGLIAGSRRNQMLQDDTGAERRSAREEVGQRVRAPQRSVSRPRFYSTTMDNRTPESATSRVSQRSLRAAGRAEDARDGASSGRTSARASVRSSRSVKDLRISRDPGALRRAERARKIATRGSAVLEDDAPRSRGGMRQGARVPQFGAPEPAHGDWHSNAGDSYVDAYGDNRKFLHSDYSHEDDELEVEQTQDSVLMELPRLNTDAGERSLRHSGSGERLRGPPGSRSSRSSSRLLPFVADSDVQRGNARSKVSDPGQSLRAAGSRSRLARSSSRNFRPSRDEEGARDG